MKRALIKVSDSRTARRLTLWLSVMGYRAVNAADRNGAAEDYSAAGAADPNGAATDGYGNDRNGAATDGYGNDRNGAATDGYRAASAYDGGSAAEGYTDSNGAVSAYDRDGAAVGYGAASAYNGGSAAEGYTDGNGAVSAYDRDGAATDGYRAASAYDGGNAAEGYTDGGGNDRERINRNTARHTGGAFGGDRLDGKYDLTVTEREGGIDICGRLLSLPLSYRQVENALVYGAQGTTLRLEGRFAVLGGERIRLTELEASLLERMLAARGEFVDKSVLLCEVFGTDVEPGILNVYIHYLREKLEKGGEKIIISSRSRGYRIDGRYLECLE